MTGMEPIWIGAAAKGLTDIVVKPVSEVLNRRLDEPFQQLLYNVFGKYIQNYNERHGLLKVLGMPEPVQLEDIYTAVQFIDSRGNWQFDPNRLEEAYRQSQARRFQAEQYEKKDGLAVANQKQYLMVLGQPGAGKSTFLRRIGLEALKGNAGSYRHGCVPVFLELKQFRTGKVDLEKAIAHEFETCGFPNPVPSTQKLLANGKLLILLDGLDEVPTQQFDAAIEKIQDFADKYKQNRFIASCRSAAYQSRFRKFVDVTMADFDDGQIQQFICNWFRSEKDTQAGTAQHCWDLLRTPNHTGTKEIAQTPLLLTLLCLVYNDTQDFPEKRAELYKQALDVLLTKWAAEKRIQRDPIYKDLTLTLETVMLGEIAYLGFAADRLFFSQREVVSQIQDFLASNLNAPRHLDGEVILQAIQIQQGILVERAKNVLSFSHLTVQEYLSAQHIADQDRADNPLIEQLLKEHLTEMRWREVWLLVAGLMRGGADPLLLGMEKHAQVYLDSPKLQALIVWTERETQDSESSFKPATKRFYAFSLVLDLARDLASNLALDLSGTLPRALDIASDRALSLAPTRSLDRDLSRALVLSRALLRALPRALARARTYKKIKILKAVDFPNLIHQLECLETRKNQQNFVSQFSEIWCQALHLDPEWLNLDESEADALNDYFYANGLIIQCKEAAVRVSPQTWEGIEARMLTLNSPPSQAQDFNDASSSQKSAVTPQPNPSPLTNPNIHMSFHGPTYGVAGIVQDAQNIHPTDA
jgi:NACHT domain